MRVLRKGYKGEDVRELQTLLNKLGYNCGTPDSSFGAKTDRAVRDFQRACNLIVDGWAGSATMSKLRTLTVTTNAPSNDDDAPKVYSYKSLTYTIVDPNKIQTVVANKKYRNVTSKTYINGTFFWAGNPNGIIVNNKKCLCGNASHAYRGYGQSVLYYDGVNLGMKRIKYISELGTVSWAIGGCGMITPYGYSPSKEGFNGRYADILRTTNKTVIGAKNSKIYLITAPSISHGSLLNRLKEMGLDYAVSLDGSGSSCMKINGRLIMASKDNRTINNWVVVKE